MIIRLDSFSKQINFLWGGGGIFLLISVFEMTAFVKTCKYTVFSSSSFCQIFRVTDEALISRNRGMAQLLSYECFLCS